MNGTRRAFRPRYRDRQTGKFRSVSRWYWPLKSLAPGRRPHKLPGFEDRRSTEQLGAVLDEVHACLAVGSPVPPELVKRLDRVPKRIREKLARWGYLDKGRMTLATSLGALIDEYEGQQKLTGKKTAVEDARRAKRLLVELCGFGTWADVSVEQVEEQLQAMKGRGGEAISNATWTHYVAAARHFERWLVIRKGVEKRLMALARKNSDLDREESRALSDDEVERLLQSTWSAPELFGLTGRERALLYHVAFCTGLRRGEIARLTASSLRLDDREPCVVLGAALTKNRERAAIPLCDPELVAALRAQVQGKLPTAKVFDLIPGRTAEMIRRDMTRAGLSVADEHGVEANFHSLRASFCTIVGRNAKTLKDALSLSRHKTPAVFLQRYWKRERASEAEALASFRRMSYRATGTDDGRGSGPGSPGDRVTGDVAVASVNEPAGRTGSVPSCSRTCSP